MKRQPVKRMQKKGTPNQPTKVKKTESIVEESKQIATNEQIEPMENERKPMSEFSDELVESQKNEKTNKITNLRKK